jgi:Tol biopolymer transport system component
MPVHLPHRRAQALAAALAGTAALAFASTASATFPARNGAIAFGAPTDQGVQLFTVGKNGRDLRQISHVAGDAVHPDWSPDGRRIVFELDTEEIAKVAFVNPDGSGLAVLPAAPGSLSEGQPSYTPDGRRIVFTRFDGAEEATWSMRLDGTDRRRITGGPQGANDPNVSPDGRQLSFVGSRDGVEFAQALFTVRLDGTDVKQLTPFFDVAIKQDWAPDGGRLLFTENADFVRPGASANMATIRPDGTGFRYLTRYSGGEVNAFAGSYSPNGRRIVFRYEDHGNYGLYTMRPDGCHVRVILPLSEFRPRYIDWGPETGHRR